IQVAMLVLLLIVVIAQPQTSEVFKTSEVSRLQAALLGLALIALIFSALVFFNLNKARPQGAFDAWSIWNRAARFIYRDTENWRATVSPELYWGNHADYPLLIPLNVAWAWQAVGGETQRVPMAQSGLFLFACIGLMFASVAYQRTLGQASLAALVLMGVPVFLTIGSGLISDIPLTYYMLAACVLLYFYFNTGRPSWLMLAGLMAGLGAWTKNEGLLFVVVSLPVVALASRKDGLIPLRTYLLGLAIPMAVVIYFKLALAPANDLFPAGGGDVLGKITDPSRYWIVLKALGMQALSFAAWPFSIFIQLAIYAFIVRLAPPRDARQGMQAVGAILLLQMLGYCAIYILTPHDLEWQLGTTINRLFLHLFPSALFLYFCSVTVPEQIFAAAEMPKS
ncbi:MAG TPA: glycosyltransferase family 39 protein, partial [Anaerolineales bacterium]